mgnify:CR=1 FL=1
MELLAYKNGRQWRDLRSSDINDYIKEITGEDFTAKDFRTWSATLLAFRALRDGAGEADGAEEQAPTGGSRRRPAGQRGTGKRVNRIMDALRIAAEEMGDTVTVTRNSYVHPGVLAAFQHAEKTGEVCPSSWKPHGWLSDGSPMTVMK